MQGARNRLAGVIVLRLALLLAALAGPAAANTGRLADGSTLPAEGSSTPFSLTDRQSVTLVEDGAGRFKVIRAGPTRLAPEMSPVPETDTAEHTKPLVGAAQGAEAGTLVFNFWAAPGTGGRLKLENGLDRTIIYSAVIIYSVDGKTRAVPTTICSVATHGLGYEAWAGPVVAVEITGFYAVPPGPQVCGNPERGQLGPPPV